MPSKSAKGRGGKKFWMMDFGFLIEEEEKRI
jgi:hypothetical protein